MLANLTYTFAIAHYSTTTLVYSLIADIALPVLLLLHVPAFFGKSTRSSVLPKHERETSSAFAHSHGTVLKRSRIFTVHASPNGAEEPSVQIGLEIGAFGT